MVMQTIQVRLPSGIIKEIDSQVKTGKYSSRSDVIRDSVRNRFWWKELIGIIPDTGDSVKEVRELRKKLSKKVNSYEDLKNILD